MWGSGVGFSTFGSAHVAWLVAVAMLDVLVVRGYCGLPRGTEKGSPRRRMMLVVALVPLALLVGDDVLMASWGVFSPQWWPLHTCNMCEYLLLVYALRPNRATGEVVFTLGLLGALLALVFPGWTNCAPYTYPCLCGFAEHGLLVAFVLMLLVGGDLHPRRKDLRISIAFVAAYLAVIYPLNKVLDTNFAFVSTPAYGSPLMAVAAVFGNPGYLVPYAGGTRGLVRCHARSSGNAWKRCVARTVFAHDSSVRMSFSSLTRRTDGF